MQACYASLDPFPTYRALRDSTPVFYNPAEEEWHVFRYEDVKTVLSNHSVFSSSFLKTPRANLLLTDPPRHREYRELFAPAFTPASIEKLREKITTLVSFLLDSMYSQRDEVVDIIPAFSSPLPAVLLTTLLGVPRQDAARLATWADAFLVSSFEKPVTLPDMEIYFQHLIGEKRNAPQDDIVSMLTTAQAGSSPLSEQEILDLCVQLMVAAIVTTEHLIPNTLLCLFEYPDQMATLRTNPDLVPQAIEEVLRYRSPAPWFKRVATSDIEMGGKQIRAGQIVVAWIGSANRDPQWFPDPDRFDMTRHPNKHLAFGHGVHFCLGAPLARLTSDIALRALLSRTSRIERVEHPLERFSALGFGPKELRVRLLWR